MNVTLTGESPNDGPLKEFLVRDIPEEYKPVVREADFVQIETTHADSIVSLFFNESHQIRSLPSESRMGPNRIEIPAGLALSEEGTQIGEKIRDGVVVDLASSSESAFKRFVECFPVSRYIGVDLWTPNDFTRREEDAAEFLQVQSDILAFVSQLRNDVCDLFFLSGLDGRPSRRNRKRFREICEDRKLFIQSLVTEIRRTLKDTGMFLFGRNEYFENHLLWKHSGQIGMNEVPLFSDERIHQGSEIEDVVTYYRHADPEFGPTTKRNTFLFQKTNKV